MVPSSAGVPQAGPGPGPPQGGLCACVEQGSKASSGLSPGRTPRAHTVPALQGERDFWVSADLALGLDIFTEATTCPPVHGGYRQRLLGFCWPSSHAEGLLLLPHPLTAPCAQPAIKSSLALSTEDGARAPGQGQPASREGFSSSWRGQRAGDRLRGAQCWLG